MNKFVKMVGVVFILVIVLLTGSCDTKGTTGTTNMAEIKIREAISFGSTMEMNGATIGGEKIDSARPKIQSIEFILVDKAVVRGTMYMTDIYGVTYGSDFNCVVRSKDGGETWEVPTDFEYLGWTKIG